MSTATTANPTATDRTAYIAPEGFTEELIEELGPSVESVHDRLVIASGPARPDPRTVAWAQNKWLDPIEIRIESISDGAKKLRALQGRWSLYSVAHHRRAQLIQDQLPKLRNPEIEFLGKLPAFAPGSWTLLEPDLILASPRCTSLFPNGEVHFNENKSLPPSRAYLKLWELFTVHGIRPPAGARVVDMGSCPGGWTWVLQQLGCRVVSVDRAPLDEKIARLPRIEFIQHNAFTLDPAKIGPVDWFFSDIICEPKKLLQLVEKWRANSLCKNFVCTIKFKGRTDQETTRLFAEIPGSVILHQYHNKHELTWVNVAERINGDEG